ncbi:hypothetical protein QYM36_002718 [Artemia franciscana]|uniref:Nucleolar GTP-binding protein 2 n=1 Tax=Artemia franciscana TaxID=6661 RepID=A0AA88IDK2_ARTSF|nr:hypothetical protein QYM36_002718 [Artemia franciscana]
MLGIESSVAEHRVVRVENISAPEDYITPLLGRVKSEYMKKTYKIESWSDPNDFLEQLAKKCGKLLKKGEPDINAVARMILNDWQRGKLPYFVMPPDSEAYIKEQEERKDAKKLPEVIQNFAKIRVDFEYEGDDDRPLEPTSEAPIESDLEADSDAEEDEQTKETVTVIDEHAVTETPKTTSEEASVEEEEGDNSDIDVDALVNRSEPPTDTLAEEVTPGKRKQLQLKSRTVKRSRSGDFVVTPSNGRFKTKSQRKLTSKEKRGLERAQKNKKVGLNFYDVVNVKNRSNKSFVEMAKAFRGHSKK